MKAADPRAEAAERGADLVQLFVSNPRSWRAPAPRSDAIVLRAWALPVYVHAPYLVNLAAADPKVRIPSRKILQQCCEAAADIGASAVIVHGGHVSSGESLADGAARWVRALEQLGSPVPLYLENTAGGEHALARRLDALARLWETIGGFGVGFCLDTCHAHAGGEELDGLVERVLAVTGRIDLVHCNDSRDPFGSGRDRHANLGQGAIPPDLLAEVVERAGAPVVVETPSEGQKDDIAFLKKAVSV